ncbi:biotin--[acetyl-CoA-carboxylase] ligase [Legionella sp. km772]|uniref:biotin--[acetyl-CoA-carboxylase] ligase n=1 Tax=Legionella sp. km772 TaxID=2498111 RepID=UPI000F8D167C|nr:biotin--[acetyl-CoA-carboxylase] ligase [Legionella sp. km772]RUR12763.1 biotin--[acetyl-CoA-carboxylase] ligase [Legionella sp. km772]
MLKLNSTQYAILTILSDGLCHSGTELGQALSISRSAVWKQIKQLNEWAIPILSIPQQGYQLKQSLILLDEELIVKQLAGLPVRLHLFNSIDSTNSYLKDLPISEYLEVCCAEQQTQGRGRFGRTWHSPFGENIYCSSRWKLECNLAKLSGLSLITSLAVVKTLDQFIETPEIKIKWPNDILWRDKKLCGSLIEIIAESNAIAQVVIGIGLNVNSDTEHHPLPDKPWCSLYELSAHFYNRNEIIAHLITTLNRYLTQFLAHDLQFFMEEWQRYDYLVGKSITVSQALESITGVACGINSSGQLILQDDEGKVHLFSSGDTSLKAS